MSALGCVVGWVINRIMKFWTFKLIHMCFKVGIRWDKACKGAVYFRRSHKIQLFYKYPHKNSFGTDTQDWVKILRESGTNNREERELKIHSRLINR